MNQGAKEPTTAAEATDDTWLAELAGSLRSAEDDRRPIPPLTGEHPGLSVADAYRIQQINVHRREAEGAILRGRKAGLTSVAMQELLGVGEPDFGAIFDQMVIEEGEVISVGALVQPRVEAEIAFVMETDLKGPGVTSADALRAVAGALPALEVVDSRVADWQIELPDTIADNASSGRVVCGAQITPLAGLDLRTVGMVLTLNGAVAATGAGAAVLGNPIRPVAWLANKLGEFGAGLKAGDLVFAGALHAMLPVAVGDTVHAEFAELGAVTTRFGE